MIHFFHRSHAKKPESGLFSDWIGYNTDDLRCSDWPKRGSHTFSLTATALISFRLARRNVIFKAKRK